MSTRLIGMMFAAAAVFASMIVTPASAKIFNYSYTGDGFASAGQVTTKDTLTDLGGYVAYDVIDITGLRNTSDIMGLGRFPTSVYVNGASAFTNVFSYRAGATFYGTYATGGGGAVEYSDRDSPILPIFNSVISESTPTQSTVFNSTYTGNGTSGAGQITGDFVPGGRGYYKSRALSA